MYIKLPADVAQNATRPQRFWSGKDLSKLKLVRSRAEKITRIGDKVKLNLAEPINPNCYPYTRHGKSSDPGEELVVRNYVVNRTDTMVEVLWQDGSREFLSARDLIPYLNPDEYDCWYKC